MRWLLVCHEFLPIGGGGSVVTYQVARALAAAGDQVEVVTAGYRGLAPDEPLDGFRVRRLAVRRAAEHGSGIPDMLSFVRAATRTLAAERARHDAALSIFSLPGGLVTWRLRALTDLPYVTYLGGSDVPGHDPTRFQLVYPLVRPLVRRVWARAATVVACSIGLRDLALRSAPGAAIELIPDGVDTARFTPRAGPRPPGPVRVLFVARLVKRKGADLLLRAFARARAEGLRGPVLEIVGDGPERPALEAEARALGLADQVRFEGQLPYERLHERLRAADLFVLPSLAEGMACIVLEAMGAGLPVLTTQVAGNDELVARGENGELVPSGDVPALGSALARLAAAGPEALAAMGRRSREVALRFDWARIGQRYRALLVAAAGLIDRDPRADT